MTKYAPLEKHLLNKGIESVPMHFSDIENIIDDDLPPSARKHRAWWSNNPSNSVITYAWLSAGYKTSQVDLEHEKLVFRRTSKPDSRNGDTAGSGGANGNGPLKPFRSPIFGCMKGTVTIPDGVDLTEPADPDWARLIEEKYPRK